MNDVSTVGSIAAMIKPRLRSEVSAYTLPDVVPRELPVFEGLKQRHFPFGAGLYLMEHDVLSTGNIALRSFIIFSDRPRVSVGYREVRKAKKGLSDYSKFSFSG
jgi:hypothetical protein